MERVRKKIDDFISILSGISDSDLKAYRKSVIINRICDRISFFGLDPEEYLFLLSKSPEEVECLLNNILINVSWFFRNPAVFETISQIVLPPLVDQEKDEIRVWSAGCSMGQEAYSIAILIDQALKFRKKDSVQPLVFATDMDMKILEKAEKGIFTEESLSDTKLGLIKKYFIKEDGRYRISPEIKDMVHFSKNDLLSDKTSSPSDSVFGSFDIIFCRNVLIYFDSDNQLKVINKLYDSLTEGGVLVLGESEILPFTYKHKLKAFDAFNNIFLK